MKGATFLQLVPTSLEAEDIYTDILSEMLLDKQKALLHVEFQKKRDAKMAERLWEYNVRATLKHECSVWSCVIYLTRDSAVETPYCRKLPNGRTIHRFDFSVVKMWEIPTQDLLQSGLRDLAPLLPLTREGQRHEVIEEAIALLDPPAGERKGELLTLTYGLASLIFTAESDQDWLVWRFSMLYDILKDTRAFRELAKEGHLAGLEEGRKEGLQQGLQEGLQKGLQKGLQEGLQEGQQEGLRQAALDVIEARFADAVLVEQARVHLAAINDLSALRSLVGKVAVLPEAEGVLPLLEQMKAATPTPPRKRATRSRQAPRQKSAE
jgi:predicted transposase YdaD